MTTEDMTTNVIAVKASHGKDVSKEEVIRMATRLRSLWPEIEVYQLSNALLKVREKKNKKKNKELNAFIEELQETKEADDKEIAYLKEELAKTIAENYRLKLKQ